MDNTNTLGLTQMMKEMLTLVDAIAAVAKLPDSGVRNGMMIELTKTLSMWNQAAFPPRMTIPADLPEVALSGPGVITPLPSKPSEILKRGEK